MVEVSIIIVNFKTPKLTRECVEAIKKSDSKTKYEVIVIDNSNDNVGFARGTNKGIRKAKGKYILLLNSDTKVKKGTIDKLIGFAKIHNDAGSVAPCLLNQDGTVQASVFRFPSLVKALRQYLFGEKGLLDKYAPKNTTEVEVATMAAFLITPKALKKVGLLNEKYFMYFEDFDYCREIKRAGLKVYYLSEAGVIHRHGASGKEIADQLNQWRRLIDGSKIYHGFLMHHLIRIVTWIGQKLGN